MVEGPGATKNARNARKLVGCRLASVDGADVPVGARLADVLCLGKEVWLIFASEAAAATGDDSDDDVVDLCGESDKEDDVIDLTSEKDDGSRPPTPPPKCEHAVRVHFGMSGSLKVDAKTPGYGARALRCAFDGGRTLEVFNVGEYGGVHAARDVERVREKVFTRTSLDVCSDAFDAAAAAARLARETTTVAVAVMNQGVSPGTGNIIKNEALHRARVAPDRKVGDLSDDEVKSVVRELRSYARAWLAGRRPPFLVYDKAACGDCGGSVAVSKGAATAGRVTFHCVACCAQTTSPQKRNAFDVLAQPPPKRPRTEPAPVRMRGHSCKKPLEKLRRVKKQNGNEGRLFWSCGRRDCKAEFKWADESFPKCGCKKTSILRICKKTGPNAGRWFHACGQRKCSFFEWAARDKLDAALGDQLRPLL